MVRRGQPARHDEAQLLTSSGKLSMQHLLPVYNVREGVAFLCLCLDARLFASQKPSPDDKIHLCMGAESGRSGWAINHAGLL